MDNFKNRTIASVLTAFLTASTSLYSDNAEARRFFIPKGGITDRAARIPYIIYRQNENAKETEPTLITSENCAEHNACDLLEKAKNLPLASDPRKSTLERRRQGGSLSGENAKGKTLQSDSVTIAKPENYASQLTDEYIVNNLEPIEGTNCRRYKGGAICGDFDAVKKQTDQTKQSLPTEEKIIDFTGDQCDTGFAIFNDKCPP